MRFLDIAKRRYTTKVYNPNENISEEIIAELKEIIRLSPSSINSQPWKFTFISDKQVKDKLADVSYWNAQRIRDASHLVVFSAIDDVEKFEKQINTHLPEGAVNYYNQFVRQQSDMEIKSWLQHQVYLSLGFFLSACASMGIDHTPMEGIQQEAYDTILQHAGYKTLFAVAIGYRSLDDVNQPAIHPKSRLPAEQIIQAL